MWQRKWIGETNDVDHFEKDMHKQEKLPANMWQTVEGMHMECDISMGSVIITTNTENMMFTMEGLLDRAI